MISIRFVLLSLALLLLSASHASASATWGIDLAGSSLSIDADTYADNGANGFRPGGIWDQDNPPPVIAFQPNFVIGLNTFDLGATLNPISRDSGPGSPPFVTSASAVGVITIDGLGSNTLEVRWRGNTLNDTFGGDGFLTESSVNLLSTIKATIDGVGPGTPLLVIYDWEYFATAVPDHEAVLEDPESAAGTLGFSDDQGTGPGNLFGVVVGGTSIDDDSNSYSLNASNPMSFLTIALDANSATRMDSPGTGPNQEDLAGSEFIGRLTLTLRTIPEPASGVLMAFLVLNLPVLIGRARHPRYGTIQPIKGQLGKNN